MGLLQDEFRRQNLWWEYPDLTAFHKPRVACHPGWFLAWRVAWAVYHTCWLVAGLVDTWLEPEQHLAKWFIYLSHWVYLSLVTSAWTDTAVVLGARHGQRETDNGASGASSPAGGGAVPWYVKVSWLLSCLTSTGCVMVTLWYWTTQAKGKELTALRLHFHGINAVYVILNLLVSRTPSRLLHLVYPVTFGLVYTAFTAVYFVCGGTNQKGDLFIYKLIDWSKPGQTFALSSISNFVFIPLVHSLLWCLGQAIEKIIDKYRTRSNRHKRMSEPSCGEV